MIKKSLRAYITCCKHMLIGMPPKIAAASFMGRLKGACGKPFRPASKTTVFEVPCSFGTAVLDE